MLPSLLIVSSRLVTVSSWVLEDVACRKNVSGTQIFSQAYARILSIPLVLWNDSLGSRQDCRRYAVIVTHCMPQKMLNNQNVQFRRHFPYTPLSFFVEFWIRGYYDPGRLWRASNQGNDLSCHMPISTFCWTIVITFYRRYRRTERWMDGYHARSVSATAICCAMYRVSQKVGPLHLKTHVFCLHFEDVSSQT